MSTLIFFLSFCLQTHLTKVPPPTLAAVLSFSLYFLRPCVCRALWCRFLRGKICESLVYTAAQHMQSAATPTVEGNISRLGGTGGITQSSEASSMAQSSRCFCVDKNKEHRVEAALRAIPAYRDPGSARTQIAQTHTSDGSRFCIPLWHALQELLANESERLKRE